MGRFVSAFAAVVAGAVVAVFAVPSCKEDKPATLPAVTAPPGVRGPTREEVLAKEIEAGKVDIADYEPIPALGMPIAYRTPDGEMWQKYPNNLMVQHLKAGSGRLPSVGQTVSVAYVGMFPGNKKEFDRSTKDKPFQFPLGKKMGTKDSVIKGWNLAVSLMRVGGKIRVFVPPDLGYGAKGMMPLIPGDSALLFDIELLDVSGSAVEFPTEPATQTGIPDIDALTKPKPLGPNLPATQPATGPGK